MTLNRQCIGGGWNQGDGPLDDNWFKYSLRTTSPYMTDG